MTNPESFVISAEASALDKIKAFLENLLGLILAALKLTQIGSVTSISATNDEPQRELLRNFVAEFLFNDLISTERKFLIYRASRLRFTVS